VARRLTARFTVGRDGLHERAPSLTSRAWDTTAVVAVCNLGVVRIPCGTWATDSVTVPVGQVMVWQRYRRAPQSSTGGTDHTAGLGAAGPSSPSAIPNGPRPWVDRRDREPRSRERNYRDVLPPHRSDAYYATPSSGQVRRSNGQRSVARHLTNWSPPEDGRQGQRLRSELRQHRGHQQQGSPAAGSCPTLHRIGELAFRSVTGAVTLIVLITVHGVTSTDLRNRWLPRV